LCARRQLKAELAQTRSQLLGAPQGSYGRVAAAAKFFSAPVILLMMATRSSIR
jgi:hypothetical protein